MSDPFKLLIIDDDESDQILMSTAIRQAGLEARISVAGSGEEGIQKANVLQPDLIILDSSLPGMDGFETCRRIKAMEGHSKIIICTGVVDEHILDKAKSVGAEDCCTKTS